MKRRMDRQAAWSFTTKNDDTKATSPIMQGGRALGTSSIPGLERQGADGSRVELGKG